MRVSRIILARVIAAVGIVALIAVSASAALAGSQRGSSSTAKAPVRVGLVVSLSGTFGAPGQVGLTASRAVVQYLNARGGFGGRPIKLVVVDDRSDPTVGVPAARNLIRRGKIAAVIGATASLTSTGMVPVAEAAKVPHLTTTALGVRIPEQGKYTFEIPGAGPPEVPAMARLAKKLGLSKLALLYAGTAYGTSFQETASSSGKLKFAEEQQLDPAGTDFTAQVLKVKGSNPDGVVCACSGTQGAIAIKNLYEAGFGGKVLTGQGMMAFPAPTLLDIAGAGALESLYAESWPAAVASTLPKSDKRKKALLTYLGLYKEAVGSTDPLAGFGAFYWDSFVILKYAWEHGGSKGGASLNAAMEKIRRLQGASALYGFSKKDHQGVSANDAVLVQWTGSGWKAMS